MAINKNANWIYFVRVDEDADKGHYTVAKASLDGVIKDTYKVTIPPMAEASDLEFLDEGDVHCSCMGFRMQKKYPLTQHKHVLLVFAHIRAQVLADEGSTGRFKLNAQNKSEMVR